jgi:hypothetical protein
LYTWLLIWGVKNRIEFLDHLCFLKWPSFFQSKFYSNKEWLLWVLGTPDYSGIDRTLALVSLWFLWQSLYHVTTQICIHRSLQMITKKQLTPTVSFVWLSLLAPLSIEYHLHITNRTARLLRIMEGIRPFYNTDWEEGIGTESYGEVQLT